jgi:A/G-specific adenine glycosylase
MAMRSDPEHFRTELARWGRSHRRSFPWRETGDPFRVLVTEVLLQRSRGRTVASVYERLFERWPSANELARARVDSIAALIRPIGLVRRAGTLRSLARAVTELGGVPRTLQGLLELPGVGPYAANATLAVGFGQRVAVVDGVTARVYRRYFGLEGYAPASTDPDLWNLVREVMPRRNVREWNWAVLDLAAAICLPKIPRCDRCPLQARCAWSHDALIPSEPRDTVSDRITGS